MASSPKLEPEANETETQEHTPTPPQDAAPGLSPQKEMTQRPIETIHGSEPVTGKAPMLRISQRVLAFEPMIRRVTTRRPIEQSPSPEPTVRYVMTHSRTEERPISDYFMRKMPIRRFTELSSSPESVVDRAFTRHFAGRSPPPQLMIRKATRRRPTAKHYSPEPVIEGASSRQITWPLPPPEAITRRMTTHTRTGLVQESPVPHSSPLTDSRGSVLLGRVPTVRIEDGTQNAELIEDPASMVSRAAEVPSRAVHPAPEVQRQSEVVSSRTSTLGTQSTQLKHIFLTQYVPSISSHALPTEEDDGKFVQDPVHEDLEDIVPPVKRVRTPTSIPERSADDVLSEPNFDNRAAVPRRQSTLRRSPIASRQLTILRQPTAQEHRIAPERVVTIPSRRSKILSGTTNVNQDSSTITKVSMCQATAGVNLIPSRDSTRIGRKPVQGISRQIVLHETDAEPVSASVLRQATRQATIPSTHETSVYKVLGLIQRNAKESSDAQKAL